MLMWPQIGASLPLGLNKPMLGQRDDLETFIFGSARVSLTEVAKVLAPMQDHRCFYCHEKIDGRAEVDHFIPWARYPRDTAHNFVLAHQGCNHDKRDMLAAQRHLEYWMRRLDDLGEEIHGQLGLMGFVTDPQCSQHIARWAYHQGVESAASSWVARGRTETLTHDCLVTFSHGM